MPACNGDQTQTLRALGLESEVNIHLTRKSWPLAAVAADMSVTQAVVSGEDKYWSEFCEMCVNSWMLTGKKASCYFLIFRLRRARATQAVCYKNVEKIRWLCAELWHVH